MTASARTNCAVSSPSHPFMAAVESEGCEPVRDRMTSASRSEPDSFYEDYDSDNLHPAANSRSNDRESRKRAEKQRRTILNTFIGELANLLPVVSDSSRKVDKTGILRLAAHDLRTDHAFGDSVKPCHMEIGSEAAECFLDIVGGFAITTTTKGLIVVVSTNVQSYLGHNRIDLLGQNIVSITHPDDVDSMKENLAHGGYPTAFDAESSTSARASADPHEHRRDFIVRLLKAGPRTETPKYLTCRIDGSFRPADRAGVAGDCHPIRRQRVRRDRAITPSGNDVIFIGMVRSVKRPFITARLLEASKQEYWTRHLVDGRIVHCDQRISLVAGYMSEEVTGVSALAFMHKEDVQWVAIALRQMYDENKPYGESCYRLVSRNGQFVYLRTKGFLEIHHSTKETQSFVCINSLIPDEEGLRMISEMKKKYSATINANESNTMLEPQSTETVNTTDIEDAKQLEKVIMNLITNLPSPSPLVRAAAMSPTEEDSSTVTEISPRSSPTHCDPSLMIIPPQTSTVKLSITKSLCVVSRSGALKRSASASSADDEFYDKSSKRMYQCQSLSQYPPKPQDYG